MRLFIIAFLCVFLGNCMVRKAPGKNSANRTTSMSKAEERLLLEDDKKLDAHIERLQEIMASIKQRSGQ